MNFYWCTQCLKQKKCFFFIFNCRLNDSEWHSKDMFAPEGSDLDHINNTSKNSNSCLPFFEKWKLEQTSDTSDLEQKTDIIARIVHYYFCLRNSRAVMNIVLFFFPFLCSSFFSQIIRNRHNWTATDWGRSEEEKKNILKYSLKNCTGKYCMIHIQNYLMFIIPLSVPSIIILSLFSLQKIKCIFSTRSRRERERESQEHKHTHKWFKFWSHVWFVFFLSHSCFYSFHSYQLHAGHCWIQWKSKKKILCWISSQ